MILVDTPKGPKNSVQYQNQLGLRTLIRTFGVECEAVPLSWGDACFEGNGPEGTIHIGIERKSLHDMLRCIDDATFAGKQRIGMKNLYTVSILMVEGFWRAREDGFLLESQDGCRWWVCRPNGKPVMYSKLRRYLISIRYGGVHVNFTRDLWHTAYDIVEEYHYNQKRWDDHTRLREVHRMAIPQMNHKPSLTRMWASDIEGLGVKKSEEAEAIFRKPIRLANADEQQWTQISGVGTKLAQSIVRQINGVNSR